MPRRSPSQYHGHHSSRSGNGRPHSARARGWAAGYTLVHAGRQLRLGPIAFWIVVGTLVIMAAWTVTTATYFAFRDDVLTRLIARQADMQFGYEDRIAELRARIDRFSSRQLLDQEQYEQKLEQILRRQAALESRANALNGLADITGAIKPPARGGAAEPRTIPRKSSLLNDKGAFFATPERYAAADPRAGVAIASASGIGAAIASLQASLDRVEQRQAVTVEFDRGQL